MQTGKFTQKANANPSAPSLSNPQLAMRTAAMLLLPGLAAAAELTLVQREYGLDHNQLDDGAE